jgi:peptide deformylase
MGHPVLRQRGRDLAPGEIKSAAIRALVTDMIDTVHDYGGIGLAAPQIGESLRLAIVEVPGGESRYGELPSLPLTVFVNPTIEVLGDETRGYWEGCLSIPGLRGYVERPQHVRVAATDLEAKPFALELHGFLATVIQHELDHLDGTLYIDRITDSRRLSFEEEFMRYLAPTEAEILE